MNHFLIVQPHREEPTERRNGISGRHGVIVGLIAAAIAFGLPELAAAQGVDIGLGYASALGLPETDIRTTIAGIIRSLLSFLGFFLVVMILLSGLKMMLAGGDQEAAEAAKASLKNAVIGFLLIMMSMSITRFIVDAISTATGSGTGLY
jgi:hypothetical protein